MEVKEGSPFCRLCLSTSVVYYSLLKNNGKEMLFALTGITVSEGVSTESCVKCWLNLKSAYCIQQRFVEADKQFRLSGTELKPKGVPVSSPDLVNFIKVEAHLSEDTTGNSNSNCLPQEDAECSELIYMHSENEGVSGAQPNCYICGVKCENDAALHTHTNSHFDEEQPCDACLINLPNIAAYRQHIKDKHPELTNRTYCCGICTLSFRYMTLYELHLAAVHPTTAHSKKKKRDVTRFLSNDVIKCEECNKPFMTKRSLSVHIKGHIRKPCPICGALITVYNLSKHINNHAANPAVCHLCGITAKNPESLRGHMYYTHSQKRLKCETCGKIFKKLYAFKMHIKKEHTGERSFTCDCCGKRFFTNYELNNHIRSRHLKERKHICQYCKRGFSSRFSMRTHERQHTNEAPYVCEVCGEAFRQNVSLRAHRRSKHNIEENKVAECPVCKKMFRDDWALKSHTRSVHD